MLERGQVIQYGLKNLLFRDTLVVMSQDVSDAHDCAPTMYNNVDVK